MTSLARFLVIVVVTWRKIKSRYCFFFDKSKGNFIKKRSRPKST
jgi:hypothetical protein